VLNLDPDKYNPNPHSIVSDIHLLLSGQLHQEGLDGQECSMQGGNFEGK
jgi:hypothetical protein